MANFNKSLSAVGLGTIATFTVPDTAIYAVDGKMTIPSINQGSSAQSALVVVVNVNGSPVYTGSAGSKGFHTQVAANASQVVTVVLSSAAVVDNALNAVKSTVTISVGP